MSIISSVFGFVGSHIVSLAGGVWSVVGVVAGYLAKRYLVPFLSVEKNRRYAEWIAAIADDLVAELVHKYPEKEWLTQLDKAIDRLIEICGIDRPVAERAIKAAATRQS
jgi:hypothetical protein